MNLQRVFRAALIIAVVSVAGLPASQPARGGRGLVPQAEASAGEPFSTQAGTLLFLPLVARNAPPKYLGVFLPLQSYATWGQTVDQFVAASGRSHAVYLISSGFACPWVNEVADIRPQLDKIQAVGATAFITWMPMNCANGGFGDVNALSLPDILNGSWDSYMQQWAQDIAALGYPVFVRWGHEMNIPSYSWGGQHAFGLNGRTDYDKVPDGCGKFACYGDPAKADGVERFLDAYHHVYNLVDPLAPNIVWVWNPNDRNWPLETIEPWNDYNNYYPGDAYTDWVAVDGYNWSEASGNGYSFTWATFDYMFSDSLSDLATRYPTKPQMVAETGSVEDAYGDPNRKAQWIRDAYRSAMRNYPLLRVVIYVDDNTFRDPASGLLMDFRINSSPQALQAYREATAGWLSEPPLR